MGTGAGGGGSDTTTPQQPDTDINPRLRIPSFNTGFGFGVSGQFGGEQGLISQNVQPGGLFEPVQRQPFSVPFPEEPEQRGLIRFPVISRGLL